MKRVLLLITVMALTAATTYWIVSKRLNAQYAARLAHEQARMEAEMARRLTVARRVGAWPANSHLAPADAHNGEATGQSAPTKPTIVPSRGLPASGQRVQTTETKTGAAIPASVASVAAPVAAINWIRYVAARPGDGSRCRIAGTSSIHDWSMESLIITGFFEVDARVNFDATQASLNGVAGGQVDARAEVTLPVRTLKSYNSKMDEVFKRQMEEPLYKNIQYRLAALSLAPVEHAAGTPFEFIVSGLLIIHGVTNAVDLPLKIVPLEGGKLKISGSTPLKMTDFKVEPPHPQLPTGEIRTGDDITVNFDWVVQRN